jgi:hypothetical protein
MLFAVFVTSPGTISLWRTPKLAIGARIAMMSKPRPATIADVRNEISVDFEAF